jgi:quercetin dioxygenase-like cupin family protein
VWRQTLAPGAATPPHRHDCDEVVLCLSGWGEVHSDGAVQRFGADCTVVLPRGATTRSSTSARSRWRSSACSARRRC